VKVSSAFYLLDVSSLASRVSVPTLVLHAREDAVTPFEGRRLAALIPDARFVPLDSRNHICWKMNRPGSGF
jgi:pimeloyl-ACP methyl ester carboxylesterase